MKKVLYLCRGITDSHNLFFAPELPEYYFAPGFFIVEATDNLGKLEDIYEFTARQGTQEITLEIKHAENGRAYIVDAGQHGKFYFKAVAMSRSTQYGGSLVSNFEGFPFFRLEPANMQQLEQACRQNDFYFIGSSGG